MYYDSDIDLECDNECGPPPPIFNIPPPPKPADILYNGVIECSENSIIDYDMCEAIPILDASYRSSPSLQTSAMILLCSVLLLIFVFISSIVIWKHKRKVQNFLPCKTSTRETLDSTAMPCGQSLTYEDPDLHLHHRPFTPLVMRDHSFDHSLNVELLHSKGIQYPSGLALQRSPPLFICASQRPSTDHYRMNDNVYEELEHRSSNVNFENARNNIAAPVCDQQQQQQQRMHSDDEDYVEDEVSLPGDRYSNKLSDDNATVATIYQEDGVASSTLGNNRNGSSSMFIERNRIERNSVMSSASDISNNNNNNRNHMIRPNIRNSSSSNESSYHKSVDNRYANNEIRDKLNDRNESGSSSGVSSFFRFKTSRPTANNSRKSSEKNRNNYRRGGKGNNNNNNNLSMNTLNSYKPSGGGGGSGCDEVPLASSGVFMMTSINNNNNNNPNSTGSPSSASNSDPISCNSNALVRNNHIDSDTNNNNNRNNNICSRNNYYDIDNEVERRNRINAQLSAATMPTTTISVATIFRDHNRMRNPATTRLNSNFYAPPQHINRINTMNEHERLSRTNPRTNHIRPSSSSSNMSNAVNNDFNFNDNLNNNNNNNSNNENYDDLYHEPVYDENESSNSYMIASSPVIRQSNILRNEIYHHQPYVQPEFITFRNINNLNNPHQPLYDSSSSSVIGAMNSDSGYSQNTQHSGQNLFNRQKRQINKNNNNSIASTTSIARGSKTADKIDDEDALDSS